MQVPIPHSFREIVRIEPKGGLRADVELKNGHIVELEDSQDVTRKNSGVPAFTQDRRQPDYVAWRDVNTTRFKQEGIPSGHAGVAEHKRPLALRL